MRKFGIFIIFIILISCSNNQRSRSEKLDDNTNYNQVTHPINLPNWFLEVPSDEVSIGMAPTYIYDSGTTQEKIKENAAIQAQRKRSSIVIAKMKMRENQRVATPIISEFNLQVASDIPGLKDYFSECEILATSDLLGMTIGLVGNASSEVLLDSLTLPVNGAPSWYKQDLIQTNKNDLLSSGKYTAVDMLTAYNRAYNEAVYNLIRGIKTQVKAAIISSNDYQEKFVEIDASLIIENIKNTRNSLVLRKADNAWVYDAYVELKWQPRYQISKIDVKE